MMGVCTPGARRKSAQVRCVMSWVTCGRERRGAAPEVRAGRVRVCVCACAGARPVEIRVAVASALQTSLCSGEHGHFGPRL